MTESETFKDKATIRATIGNVVVGTLQHPVNLAKDWRVYLKSDNPAEEKRRETIRQELQRESAGFDSEDRVFLETYEKIGCDVGVTVGDNSLFPHE